MTKEDLIASVESGAEEWVLAIQAKCFRAISIENIRRWICEGILPYVRIGGRYYTTEGAARAFLRDQAGVIEGAKEQKQNLELEEVRRELAELRERFAQLEVSVRRQREALLAV